MRAVESDIRAIYQELYEESLKIKKSNIALLRKLDLLEREKEKLSSELQDSAKNLSEVMCKNERLEETVKTLLSDLEKSNSQLEAFSSGTKKLDSILGMNKSVGDRRGLGYDKNKSHAASTSRTSFVPASTQPHFAKNPDLKDKRIVGQRTRRSRRNFGPQNHYQSPHMFGLRFVPTCHHCGALGHIRPRCRQFVRRERNQDIPSQVNHLSS